MSQTITGHFDGKVIVPDRPVKLPVGKRLRIQIDLLKAVSTKKSKKPLTIIGSGQFSSGIPHLATNKKHMEGFGKS